MSNLAGISKTLGTKTPVAKVNTSGKGIGVIPTGISKPNTAKPVSAPTKSPGLAVYNAPKKIVLQTINPNDFTKLDPAGRLGFIDNILNLLDEKKRGNNILFLNYILKEYGLVSEYGSIVVNSIVSNLSTTGNKQVEGYLTLLKGLITDMAKSIEPFLHPILSSLLLFYGDRANNIREMAAFITTEYMKIVSPHSFRMIFPSLVNAMGNEDWRVKVAALEILKLISPRMSRQLSPLLPIIIPRVSDCITDSKKQVQVAGIDGLSVACNAIQNDDIRPLVPKLVSVIARPEESEATLNLLLETTFVANVDAAVLALLAPLLFKVLRGRSSALKRKAARVIDIMCRLVNDPKDAAPFIPMLLPALDRVIEDLVDAEICSVAKAARETLVKAVGEERISAIMNKSSTATAMNKGSSNSLASMENSSPDLNEELSSIVAIVTPEVIDTHDKILDALLATLHQQLSSGSTVHSISLPITSGSAAYDVCDYISQLCANLIVFDTAPNPNIPVTDDSNSPVDASEQSKDISGDLWRYAVAMTKPVEWKDCTIPFLSILLFSPPSNNDTAENEEIDIEDVQPVLPDEGKSVDDLSHQFRLMALQDVPDNTNDNEDDASNVCNFEFSLAFGGKILLQNTYLKLGRGRRYGVMAKNGSGKTTLLVNLGTGNIEGMPSHLKTVYVQHDDSSDDKGLSLIDEMMNGKDMIESNVTREEAIKALTDINFTMEMITSPRSAMSGGWKMKLLIVRALLSRANILLLDEPTNHLDAGSVQWLKNCLNAQHDITCLIVSHDVQFLDDVITDVIHYENKKLVYYHGNMGDFVKIHPEAKFYYELSGSSMQFKFPTPERLEGITSTTRAILKMENVSYTYPGASKPTLRNATVKVCLGSRVGVLGANGAGKSTLIKMLVKETEPDPGSGEVWKHLGVRIAYIAQHSLHHVEQHLDVSPVDYIKWRFAGGVDKEDLAKPTMKMSEEEVENKKEKRYGDVEQVLGRRKNGRTMEYECTYVGQISRDPNKYIPLEQMIELGYGKLVEQMDAKVAAMAAGLDMRPLLTAEIQNHLTDFNLEAEFGTHGTIRRLSGGQKVKLVLAAAMWNRPHIAVFDEPTNYLDREALGALTQAIKNFGGGVVIISHNAEFVNAICTETWLVKDGQCFTEGEIQDTTVKAASSKSIKRATSATQLEANNPTEENAVGNINNAINSEVILNPKTLEGLSKKETRKLERLALVAGVTLKEYVSKINFKSPEWKWL